MFKTKSAGLDIIIVDNNPYICQTLKDIITEFYKFGEIISFTDVNEAMSYCLSKDIGIAILIVDVFLKTKTGFQFLNDIEETFPSAHEDSIMITGYASDDVVNTCVASGIKYLLEKPIDKYTLQLSIRTIVEKYLKFAKKLMKDPEFADTVARL